MRPVFETSEARAAAAEAHAAAAEALAAALGQMRDALAVEAGTGPARRGRRPGDGYSHRRGHAMWVIEYGTLALIAALTALGAVWCGQNYPEGWWPRSRESVFDRVDAGS